MILGYQTGARPAKVAVEVPGGVSRLNNQIQPRLGKLLFGLVRLEPIDPGG